MNFLVIGSGAWGTALGNVLSHNKEDVTIFAREVSRADEINTKHTNSKYFPFPHKLEENLKATTDLKSSLMKADVIVISVPTSSYREVLTEISSYLDHKVYIVSSGKGFDPVTHMRLSSLIRKIIPEEKRYPVVSLLGPSFGEEVIMKMLTAITSTCVDKKTAEVIQKAFSNEYFRLYVNEDEIGAEYSAAIKNVIAIASGILTGLGYGENSKAALVTRGLAEISRLGVKEGGKMNTFLGLTGLGDLMMTCNSSKSRNFQAGLMIGHDNSASRFLKTNQITVEGIKTAEVIHFEAIKMKTEMPIVDAVYSVLYQSKTPRDVVKTLMKRSLKSEF